MPLRPLLPLTLLATCLLLALSGCGSSSAGPSQIPVFTSMPGTAASQGVAYTYGVTATDPAGLQVTFAISDGPAGATMLCNPACLLSWVPTAAQSRVSNSFTVTASTTGGSATQNWTVSPNGTITINWVDTHWLENGPAQTPINGVVPIYALVPQSDGSYAAVQGGFVSPGVATILNVPAGYFWLSAGPLQASGIWTSSSTIDLGRDILGPVGVGTAQNTTFNFNVSGLAPTTASGSLAAFIDSPFTLGDFQVPANSTTLSSSETFSTGPDWSKIDAAFLMQFEPAQLGTNNTFVLTNEEPLTGLSFTDGASNSVTAALQAAPQTSLNLSVPGSQWNTMFSTIGPAPGVASASWLSVDAEPYISGRNATPNLIGPDFPMVSPIDPSSTPPPTVSSPDFCLNGASLFIGFLPNAQPPITTDTNFGTLSYGDPFPSTWTRAAAFCEEATTFVTIPGASVPVPFPLLFGDAIAPTPSLAPLAPIAGTVTNPTVNSASLFSAATLNTTSVTLSWSAPTIGSTPYGYVVIPFVVTVESGGAVGLASSGLFRTGKTSVTLPPLKAGSQYIFVITTLVDAAANVETAPYRSALPSGFAQVVSAPITISSGATTPTIRGNSKAVRWFTEPHLVPVKIQR